jgi:hypothetical protein
VAATGEECYYQTPILEYFDSSYDKIFDAHVEHHCALLGKKVVPARQCGTVCPSFKPLWGMPRTDRPRADEGAAQAAKSAIIRKEIQRQLQAVCDKLRECATSLAQRTEIRKQRLRELDNWLGRPDTQLDVLGNDIAAAEQDISKALAAQARNQRQLQAIREGRVNPRDVELVWVDQEHWATKLKHARERKEHAEELLGERERREATYAKPPTRRFMRVGRMLMSDSHC